MMALPQLLVLAVFTAGLGYWVWLWARRPAPQRGAIWLWCGLAGFALVLLGLQALAYADWPLRKTLPWVAGFAGLGFVLVVIRLWRARMSVDRREWGRVGLVLAAGAAAGLVQATSLIGIGHDRFIGHAQIDQVNYVTMAQFLMDEPYSTDLDTIGLRPWLWMPLQWKQARATECIALGATALLTGTDAQRAWGGTTVFFTMLLAMALAALWRVAGAGDRTAATLGFVGAATPVVAYINLIGFYSQLTAFFVFPALIAVCWAGALPRKLAAFFATVLLGFLAGTYTEFWPIGVLVMGGSLLRWPLRLWQRVAAAGGIAMASLLLTGVYLTMVAESLVRLNRPSGDWAQRFVGFVPDGISWRGWGRNFLTAGPPWVELAGGLVVAGVVLAWLLSPARRRQRLAWALVGPAGLAAYFLLSPQTPVYPAYKLLATFAPLCLGLAGLGALELAARFGPGSRRTAMILLALAGGGVCWSAVATHVDLVQATRHKDRERLDRLWATRDRVEQTTGTYLIENGNTLVGAWLAYFARASSVYYDLPELADSRIPTEAAPFRKIPAAARLEWLDLDRTGPVVGREPSVQVQVAGARSTFRQAQRAVYVLGSTVEIRLTRADGFPPREREYALEFGLTPLPGAEAFGPVLTDATGAMLPGPASGAARRHSLRLRLVPGVNVFHLQVQPAGAAAGEDRLLLQALSLERAEALAR